MGWSASYVRRKVVMCRFWNRNVSMEDNHLPKIILNWDVNLKYVNTWSNNMKEVLYKLNMNNSFDNREPVSINSVWALLHEIICKTLGRNIPKLRTYVKFEKHFEVEPYIFSFMSCKRRSYLAQFRSGIQRLQIEVGMQANTNVEERLCLVYNEGLVEDEQHFIFHCNYYNLT